MADINSSQEEKAPLLGNYQSSHLNHQFFLLHTVHTFRSQNAFNSVPLLINNGLSFFYFFKERTALQEIEVSRLQKDHPVLLLVISLYLLLLMLDLMNSLHHMHPAQSSMVYQWLLVVYVALWLTSLAKETHMLLNVISAMRPQ